MEDRAARIHLGKDVRREAEDRRRKRKPESGEALPHALEGKLHALRAAVLKVRANRRERGARGLSRDEAHGNLRYGGRGYHGLRARPAVAGVDSVDLDRRLEGVALDYRLPHLPAARVAAHLLAPSVLGLSDLLGGELLVVSRKLYAVAEPGDGDGAVRKVQARDELRHALRRIRRDAAVLAGMEVARRAVKAYREARDAPQPSHDRRPQAGRGGRVADEHDVGREATAQARGEADEGGASGLLLSV